MPITQWLLLQIPTPLLGLLIFVCSIALAVATILVVHFIVPQYKPKKQNNVITILFGAKALIYTTLLLTVLFISWADFKSTGLDIQKEADSLVELYRGTDSFLPEIKEHVRVLLQQYIDSLIHNDWNALAKSELSPRSTEIAKEIWQVYASYEPKNSTEQIFLQESVRKLYELRENRTRLLSDSEMGVYPLIWLVLILGEIVTVASIGFFAEGLKAKIIMAILYAALIALIFFAILLFDFPFTGAFVVSSKPLARVMLYW